MTEPALPATETSEFPKTKIFLGFSRHLFTILEWLTITAAITYAAIKTRSISLWLVGYALQLVIAVYVLFAVTLWIRPRFRHLKNKKTRYALAALVAAVLAFGGNWLIHDTVLRLVRIQLPQAKTLPCIPCGQ